MKRPPPGSMELGEICRVHRGQVTGCNAVWIAGGWTGALPDAVLVPAVTRARELLDAGAALSRADIVIRLHDRRIMAVECKTSNSAVNSFKRINREAVGKARAWLTQLGDRQIVPCAVIDGVFNPANLEAAQGEGLAIVWSHRLSDLAEFIEETRSSS